METIVTLRQKFKIHCKSCKAAFLQFVSENSLKLQKSCVNLDLARNLVTMWNPTPVQIKTQNSRPNIF